MSKTTLGKKWSFSLIASAAIFLTSTAMADPSNREKCEISCQSETQSCQSDNANLKPGTKPYDCQGQYTNCVNACPK